MVKHVNNTCGLKILDLINDGTRNKKGYRSVLVVIDNFSDQRWSIQLKSETSKALTKKDSHIINKSNRKPNLIEKDDRKEFRNEIFTEMLNSKDVEIFSSYTSKRAVFAERYNRKKRDLLGKPVFFRKKWAKLG